MSRNGELLRYLHTEAFYPGEGLPPRPGEDRPGLSPFGRLAMGQNLGKPSILVYDRHSEDVQPSPVDMVDIQGDNLDACSLVLTLHPPRVIPIALEDLTRLDMQNLTGEQTNGEVSICDFPKMDEPIRWPPLEASIEYGTGGCSTKVVVDYVNGVTLSMVASFLRVRALVTQNRCNGDISGTSAAYHLAAHVGPGFAESHAQRTVFVGDVEDDDQSGVFDVPVAARFARLIGRQAHHHQRPVHTIGWIRFWQSPRGHDGVGDVFVGDHQCRAEVPNAGQYFSVFNESGHKMKMAVIFGLSL